MSASRPQAPVTQPAADEIVSPMGMRPLARAVLTVPGTRRLAHSSVAVMVGLALGAVALAASGISPQRAYADMLQGAFGSAQSLANTAVQATPLLLASLAVGISFRAGVFNIGAGGQLGVGALASALIGANVHLGPGLELIAMALGAMAAGAFWAGIAGVLKAYTGANEVITTLMLNYVAANLIDYAVTGPAKAPGPINQTPQLSGSALFPTLVPDTQLTVAFLVAVAMVPLVWLLLYRTAFGFRLRMVGLNPDASTAAGFSVRRLGVAVLTLSGALAGLAGMTEVAGVLGSVPQNFSLQAGFTAIVVALLGNNAPLGILLASLLLGGLTAGSTTMEAQVGVSGPFVIFLEALMIGAVVGMPMVVRFWNGRRRAAAANAKEPK